MVNENGYMNLIAIQAEFCFAFKFLNARIVVNIEFPAIGNLCIAVNNNDSK